MRTHTLRTASGALVEVEVADEARVPTKASLAKVRHFASNNRTVRVGLQATVTMSDETVERCQHRDGHYTREAAVQCATKMVNRLNREAGIDPKIYQ